jgi:hypothetical protein
MTARVTVLEILEEHHVERRRSRMGLGTCCWALRWDWRGFGVPRVGRNASALGREQRTARSEQREASPTGGQPEHNSNSSQTLHEGQLAVSTPRQS